MKLTFLKNLFASHQNSKNRKESSRVNNQQAKEINKLIDAAVEEVIVADQSSNNGIKNHPYNVIQDPVLKEVLSPKIEFTISQEANGSSFEVDEKNGIAKITWNGHVNLVAAQKLVTLVADSVEFHGYKKLLLDRSNLVEFDTEARLWIKGMLKSRAKQIVKMVDRLAIVKSQSAKGSIFSNLISSAIKIVMPNLKMEKFDSADDALDWLS